MIIGVTGNIGCGKTTVTQIFKEYGFKVIDADRIAHKILNKSDIKRNLIKHFGKVILKKGRINRDVLRKIAFSSKKNWIKLNKITHPEIIKEIKLRINKKEDIIIEASLLIEAKALNLIDKLIVVKCRKKEQLKRLLNKYKKDEVKNILNFQLPISKKIKYADYIIDNSNNIKETKKQVKKIIDKLRAHGLVVMTQPSRG